MEDKAEYLCKYCSPYSGQCYIQSARRLFTHINIACMGKCDKFEKKED